MFPLMDDEETNSNHVDHNTESNIVDDDHIPGITYDGQRRVFRLRCKSSLYVFRVDDARNLEHLYWGPTLSQHDDITYLLRSHVPAPFDPRGSVTAASIAKVLGLDELNRIDSLERLSDRCKHFSRPREPNGTVQTSEEKKRNRRLENASWRLWHRHRYSSDVCSPNIFAHVIRDADDDHYSMLHSDEANGVLSAPHHSTKIYTPTNTLSPPSSTAFSQSVSQQHRHQQQHYQHQQLDSRNLSQSWTESDHRIPVQDENGETLSVAQQHPHQIRQTMTTIMATTTTPIVEPRAQFSDLGVKSLPLSSLPSSTSITHGLSMGSFTDLSVQDQATNWGALDPEELGKNTKLLEFSDQGTGDYRDASFKVTFASDGSSVCPLQYKRHRIVAGKPPMPSPLPAMYTDRTEEATTLIVEMEDSLTGLRFLLYYTVMHDYDIITRRTVVVNDSDKAVTLRHIVSGTFDFDAESEFYMTQLAGGWARERDIVTQKLEYGVKEIKSSRGASSHQFNPFIMVTPSAQPDEDVGDCFGFALVYSGNFSAKCEVTEYGRLRVNMGINPDGFMWHLDPKSSSSSANGKNTFHTPEVVMSYSQHGMGGLSRTLHRAFRERLIPRNWRYRIPPVLINTWEAAYFDVNHEVVVEIAQAARKANIELLVLDDGWFGQRDNTLSGLGDWYPNRKKFPFGVDGIARAVNEIGLKFGIWVEPEMVSLNSNLYRKHSDWCLCVPSRNRTTGRNQLVLDFSRKVVRDHIYDQLYTLLTCANIEYVKWDMNRHLTEVFSQEWHSERQGEVTHRFMLGLYEILGRLTERFPNVLFETCSGGGGRFDAGMLYFAPQIWTSDNTDALSRVSIQYGTSIAYPAMCMGAHVSAVPNHQTLRTTPMKTRAIVAMSGTFGFELDPRELTDDEMVEIRKYIKLHKRIAALVYRGDMYRLWSPFKSDSAAWMFVAPEARWAIVIAVNIRRVVGRLLPRLKLRGLIDHLSYSIEEVVPGTVTRNPHTGAIEHTHLSVYQYGAPIVLTGRTLRNAGLPIKFLFDSDSVLLELTAINDDHISHKRHNSLKLSR